MDSIASQIVSRVSDQPAVMSIMVDSDATLVSPTLKTFSWRSWILPRFFSLCYFVLLLYWIYTQQNGFTHHVPSMLTPARDIVANGYLSYHALAMSLWAVFCYQETIMAFAIPLYAKASYQARRWIHIGSHLLGVLFGIGGMTAILLYKQSAVSIPVSGTTITIGDNPFYVPYSPHAWLGAAFMGAWVLQCVGRFIPAYVTPAIHRFCGRVMYISGLGCCALGLQQQQTRQLITTLIPVNITNTNTTSTIVAVSNWWFSQPSLGVLLLGAVGIATFYVGVL
jgi:hypothetical protein